MQMNMLGLLMVPKYQQIQIFYIRLGPSELAVIGSPNDALQRPRKRDRRADHKQLHGQVRRPKADGAELSKTMTEQDLDGAEERSCRN